MESSSSGIRRVGRPSHGTSSGGSALSRLLSVGAVALLSAGFLAVASAGPLAGPVAAGGTTGGRVVAWGDNSNHQTEVPAAAQSGVVAISAGSDFSLALKSDGTVVAWGYDDYHQTEVPSGLSNVVAISAGSNFSLALKSDGTVVGWGYDGFGEPVCCQQSANIGCVPRWSYTRVGGSRCVSTHACRRGHA